MTPVVIDFETYFDKDFNLKKLPTLIYVRSTTFKVHGAALKIGDAPSRWITASQLQAELDAIDWSDALLISHNSNFDNVILHERYGVTPAQRCDTLGLCRMLLPRDLDLELDKIGPLLGLQGKAGGGAALTAVKGVYDLTPELEAPLGEYACVDADITYGVWQILWPNLPELQREVMDLVVRMSTEGVLEGDPIMFDEARDEVLAHRAAMLEKVPDVDIKQLTSRNQFAELLRAAGVEPPMKRSPATGKPTYAFSKGDPDYVALQTDPRVGDLVRARMAYASNNAISRIESLSRIASLPPHTLPVQLNVSGAHTHRLSGGGKINSQNLNARGPGAKIRQGITAPEGYVILVYDQSGIELRMNMWFSSQFDVLDQLRHGHDVYIVEASDQLQKPQSLITKTERQFGKIIRLGAQYGMGPPKFRVFVATGPLGMDPMYITETESQRTIYTYRANHPYVVGSWDFLTKEALPMMAAKGTRYEHKAVVIEHEQIRLPTGLCLHYPGLEATEDGWTWGLQSRHYIWGGTMQENIVQALSGQLINSQMVQTERETYARMLEREEAARSTNDPAFLLKLLNRYGRIVHQVHDEILLICHEDEVKYAKPIVENVMTTVPDWAPDLPLAVEGGYARSYSK